MTKTDLFRKLIREEVAKAIRAELPKILKEVNGLSSKTPLAEERKVPMTLNQAPPIPKFSGTNPISSLLNETAIGMAKRSTEGGWGTISMDTDDVHTMGLSAPATVGGVEDMLSKSRNSVALEAVEVSVVPNFNNLMDSLISKGHM